MVWRSWFRECKCRAYGRNGRHPLCCRWQEDHDDQRWRGLTRKEARLDTEKAVEAALVSASSGNTSREVGEEEEDVEARIEARIEKAVVDAVATTVCAKEEELRRAVEALEGTLEEQQRVFQKRLQRMQAKQKSDLKDFKDLEKSQSTTAAALANAADEALVKEQQYVTPCGRGLLLRWLHWCGDG